MVIVAPDGRGRVADELHPVRKTSFMRTEENGPGLPVTEPIPEKGPDLDFSEFMDGLVVDVKAYVRAETDHFTLHATEKAAVLMGKALRQVVMTILLGTVLMFLNIALAFHVGDLLASRPLGFVIVAGIYVILLGAFQLWWSQGGSDRFVLDRINDLNNDEQ